MVIWVQSSGPVADAGGRDGNVDEVPALRQALLLVLRRPQAPDIGACGRQNLLWSITMIRNFFYTNKEY